MGRAELLFKDLKATLVEAFGLGILALILIDPPQIVQGGSCIGMVRTELLSDVQCSLKQWLRLLVFPLILIKDRQIVQGGSGVEMVRTQLLLSDAQRTQV